MQGFRGVWAVALAAGFVLAGCSKPDEAVLASEAPPAAPAVPVASYVGTWGVDLEQCKIPQDLENAPMDMNASGFDQHEAHCTFKTITETAPGSWKVSEACTVEGNDQADEMTFSVAGDTLTIDPGARAYKLVRCP
jgi:hypothetical protein